MEKAEREWRCELSTVDTGLLMMGALFCREYFDRSVPNEDSIRVLADTLYGRVDWRWAMGDSHGIRMSWDPERGWSSATWRGYNEAMLVYILALGSPTHPVPEACWDHWTSTYLWDRYRGQEFISFGPLFGHQYSHAWIDFRGIRDAFMRRRGIDYAENSRRATYTHRDYAAENPGGWVGYCDSVWGFTACDGPGDTTLTFQGGKRRFQGYAARGVSVDWTNDDGTIAPTAAGGSLPFAPEICVPALRAMRKLYGNLLFRPYGFADAFNPTFRTGRWGPGGWVDPDFIGIDQGPIVLMIENLRNDFVWKVMRKSPYIVRGLKRAGFAGGWLDGSR
jgi:hypothetical protein